MAQKPTVGTKQFGLEMNSELVDQWREFCRDYGGVREQTELALKRHMANPPAKPPPVEPLPPVIAEPPVTRKRGPKPKPKT